MNELCEVIRAAERFGCDFETADRLLYAYDEDECEECIEVEL